MGRGAGVGLEREVAVGSTRVRVYRRGLYGGDRGLVPGTGEAG